jgi:uncharacterized membrane protein YkvA (DUF1232 family)
MSQTGEAKTQTNGVAGKQARLRRDFWPKLKRNLARIPFAEDLVAAYFCALDPATPIRAKAILLGALAYFVMPADLVPDFLIALGFVDDAAVLMAAISAIGANLKPHHRERARQVLMNLSAEVIDAEAEA